MTSTTGTSSAELGGVSNQLASLVPTFDPATDDVLMYQKRVELVLAAWPKGRLTELVTRLILGCKGSAFEKLQIHQQELLVGEEKSVHRIIELLGGQWGRIPLERQYQDAERALYETQQRSDETNDSYLARSDVLWSKLLARKLSLEDLQAYILLRGSSLSSDEKKKVILDSEQSGQLTVARVTEAIRTLGANFFMDMTNQKKPNKAKVYDQSTLFTEAEPEQSPDMESALVANEDISEEDFIEQLLQEGDSDAAFIQDFEGAASETLQDDPELATALTAYQQARHRLSERFRNRGFWPSRPFQGSNKGKGFQSKSAGKGKGSSMWSNRPKKTLQERIMSSTCRLCNQRGHWKAECPLRSQGSGSQVNSNAGSSQAPTTMTIGESTVDSLPLEFLNLPETSMPPLEELPATLDLPSTVFLSFVQGSAQPLLCYRGRILGKSRKDSINRHQPTNKVITAKDRLRWHLPRMNTGSHEPMQLPDQKAFRIACREMSADAKPVKPSNENPQEHRECT